MANDTISILILADTKSPVVDCIEQAFPPDSNTTINTVHTLSGFRDILSSTTPDIVLMDTGVPPDIRTAALDIPPASRPYPIVMVTVGVAVDGVVAGDVVIDVDRVEQTDGNIADSVFDSIVITPETAAVLPQTVSLVLRAWKLSVQLTSGSEESNKLAKTAQAQQNRLSALLRASNVILTTTSFADAARRIFDICRDATGAQSGYIALLSEDGSENEVLFLESGGLPCTVDPELPMPIRGLRARAYETGKPVYDNDFMNSDWLRFMPKGHVTLDNVMFAPLNRNGKTIGLIGLANKPEDFTDDDAQIAGSLADRIAAVLIMTREQEILRESEDLYRQLFEAESDAIFLIDNETGDILEANNAASVLYGYSREQLLGMRNGDLSSEPEETARVTHGTPIIEDNIVTIPLRYHRKQDGTVFPVEITGRFFLRKGRPVHIAAIRDISERIRSDEALRESEGRVREKLNAILSPEGTIEDLELADIIDTRAFQSMMDDFHKITGFNAAVLDLDGTVLVSIGLQDICTKFHHKNPESFKHCRESDTQLTTGVEPGVFKVYRCKNNMLDVVTPIYADGKHIGNLFLGQFFYDDEDVDIEVFREQARRYGFDEAAYLEALGRVPRWSRETVQTAMSFYLKLSSMISLLSHSNLKLARILAERDQLNDSLRRKEAALTEAQHLAKVGNWEYSLTDDSIAWSSEMFRIFGRDPAGDLPSRPDFLECVYQDDWEHVNAAIKAGLSDGISHNLEFRIVTGEGEPKWVWVKGSAERDESGTIVRLYGTMQDIDDRKKTEEALLESETKFRSIAEQIGDVIFITDSEGAVTYISPASEKMFGCMPEDMTGRHFTEFLYPSFIQTSTEAFTSAIENRQDTRNLELLMKRGDGTLFHGEVSGTRYVLGNVTGTLGVIRDISDKKQAEEEKKKLEQQVQHAQKLESLGVLAGGIAHDFNNILMVILGHADLAMEDTSTISPARKSLREIVTASRRAAELCNQMLAYSGRASFVLERIHMGTVIEELAHLLKSSINKKAAFNMNITRDLPAIEADPSQIRQIAMNLIINASDAIGDRSGIITLTVGATRFEEEYLKETEIDSNLPAGLYVYLEVSDTGCGMDEETRTRLFEPFFTTKFTGRGLGLAAVLGIVRAHRGAIKVYSEEGKGTTFKVLIPAAEDNVGGNKSAENGSVLADWKGSGTILIADDDESVRALCARMLERLGFTVITAADGSIALDVYRQRRNEIDLVILDLTMPRMDGVEALSALRRENSKLKIVLASGYSEEDVASRVAGKGLSGVIQKPYTLSKLKELLSTIM